MVTPRQALQGPQGSPAAQAGSVAPVQDASGAQVAAMGDALGRSGAQGVAISAQMQADLDAAKTQEASARYAELLANTEAEFRQLRGEDAHKKFDEVQSTLHTKRAELEKFLTSSKQRTDFGRDSSARQTVALNRMNAHRAEQFRVYRVGAASASFDRAMRDRVNAAVQGDAVDYIRQSMVMSKKLDQLAELNHLSDEQKTLAHETAEGSVNAAVVEGLLNVGAVARAGAHLEGVEGQFIPAQKKTELQKRVQRAGNKQRAEMLVDEVRGQGNLLSQRRYVRELDEPVEVKDELLRRVRVMAAEDRQQNAQAKADALAEGRELALAGQPIPEELETRLSDLGVLAQFRAHDGNVTTEAGEYMLETLTGPQLVAQYQTPEELYNAFEGVLSRSDMRLMRARWGQALSQDEQAKILRMQEQGKAGSTRSKSTGTDAKSVEKLNLEEVIDEQLGDFVPDWRDADFGNLTRQQARTRRRLKNAIVLRVDSIARSLGHSTATNEDIMQGVRDVLKIQTTGGRAAFGMDPRELAEAELVTPWEGETFSMQRAGTPGFHPDESAKQRYVDARKELERRGALHMARELGVQLPEDSPVDSIPAEYLSMARGFVSTGDVINELMRQQHQDREDAEEINQILDSGKELPQEIAAVLDRDVDPLTAARIGPLQRERHQAHGMARTAWLSTLAANVDDLAGAAGERDDAAFISLWPRFRDSAAYLSKAYPEQFSADEDSFRKEVIDLVFPDASPADRHRLWRHSAGPQNAFARMQAAVQRGEPLHLKGYLDSTPVEVEFSFDFNGRRIQR